MIRIARKNLALWATIGAVFFLLIQVSCDLYLPTVTADLVNRGIVQKDMGVIWNEGIKMLIVAAIGLVAAGLNVYFAATQSMKVGEKLRSQIYHKVLRFSNREMDEFGDSSLITRSTNDIVQIQNVMVQMLRMMLQSPVMLVAACVLAYVREPQLTKVFFISLPILAIIVMAVMYFAVPLFKSIQKKTDRINLIFREGLTGVRVIRAFRQEEREQNRFKKANEDYTQTGIKAFTIVSTLFPVVTLILGMTNVAIILLGGHLVANMSMQVGDLIAFMTYATQIMISFMMLSMIFVFVPRASASATRVNAVLDQPISIHNAPEKDQEKISINQAASLEFKNVDFRFHVVAPLIVVIVFGRSQIRLHLFGFAQIFFQAGNFCAKGLLGVFVGLLFGIKLFNRFAHGRLLLLGVCFFDCRFELCFTSIKVRIFFSQLFQLLLLALNAMAQHDGFQCHYFSPFNRINILCRHCSFFLFTASAISALRAVTPVSS